MKRITVIPNFNIEISTSFGETITVKVPYKVRKQYKRLCKETEASFEKLLENGVLLASDINEEQIAERLQKTFEEMLLKEKL